MEYAKNCLTCKYWLGNKEKQLEAIKEKGHIVMDRKNGWPEEGTCKEIFDLARLDIDGDSWVTFLVDANFGCILHKT
jgi:hypothetical protein